MNTPETLGYAAVTLFGVSLLVNDQGRRTGIHLVGASLLLLYGVLSGALPVTVLGAVIIAVDVHAIIRQVQNSPTRVDARRLAMADPRMQDRPCSGQPISRPGSRGYWDPDAPVLPTSSCCGLH